MVLDLILAGYFILVCFFAAKKGFIRSLVEIIGVVAAGVTAFWLSQYIAEVLYYHTFRSSVIASVSENLSKILSADSVSEQLSVILGSVPPFFQDVSESFGVTPYAVGNKLSIWLGQSSASASAAIADEIIGPVLIGVSRIFIVFILFSLLVFLVKILAAVIDKFIGVFTGGFLNKLLGAVLGAGKALMVTLIICIILNLWIKISDDSFTQFMENQLESSVLFSAVYQANPFQV